MRTSKTGGSPQLASLSSSPSKQQQEQHNHPEYYYSSPNDDEEDSSALASPFFYEPTSVLDPHLTSSSPTAAAADPLLLPLDFPSSSPDEWDPATWFLGGGKGDSALLNHNQHNPLSLPPFPDTFAVDFDCPFPDPTDALLPSPEDVPTAFDQIHLDQLIRAAQAVESNDPPLAGVILARLNHALSVPTGRPIQRAACFHHDALLLLLSASAGDRLLPPAVTAPPLSPLEIVRKIAAYRDLSALSPIPQFASFTANQAVLEAVLDGSGSIHLIDFEIGLGGHWSSFLHAVAERRRNSRLPPPPSFRITAVVAEESLETNLAAENLRDFARGLGLRLAIDFVPVGSPPPSAAAASMALAAAVRISTGESVAVIFTPASFRLLGGGAPESVAGLLRFIRRTAPRVAVFVDADSPCHHRLPTPASSFRRAFTAGLEYYSVVLESLDAAAAAVGCGRDHVRTIERSLIRPRVMASVAAAASYRAMLPPWGEMFEGAGMRPVPFSEFTESQAELLAKEARTGGYYVAGRERSLVLSWHGRELASTSAWRF